MDLYFLLISFLTNIGLLVVAYQQHQIIKKRHKDMQWICQTFQAVHRTEGHIIKAMTNINASVGALISTKAAEEQPVGKPH